MPPTVYTEFYVMLVQCCVVSFLAQNKEVTANLLVEHRTINSLVSSSDSLRTQTQSGCNRNIYVNVVRRCNGTVRLINL